MKAKNLSEAAIGAFKRNFDQLVEGATGMVCSKGGWDAPMPMVRCALDALVLFLIAWSPTFAICAMCSVQVPEAEIDAVTELPTLASLPNTNGNVQVCLAHTRRAAFCMQFVGLVRHAKPGFLSLRLSFKRC